MNLPVSRNKKQIIRTAARIDSRQSGDLTERTGRLFLI